MTFPPRLFVSLRRAHMFVLFSLAGVALAVPASACTPNGTGVTVCTPATGSTVTSPVAISAAASAANPVVAMAIYVDNQLAGQYNSAAVDTSLTMTAANHYVVVQAWDSAGAVYKTPLNITVSDTTTSGGSTSTSSTGSATGCSATTVGVTICSPTANSTNPASFTVTGAAMGNNPITALAVYLDNTLVSKASGTSISAPVTTTAGSHYLVVQAWDSTGAVYKTPETINVSTTTTSGGTTSGGTTGGTGSGSTGTSGCSAATVGVTICSPTPNSTNPTSFTVIGAALGNNPITALAVYLDNNLITKASGTTISAPITTSAGTHYLVVQAWDSTGYVYKTPETITVSTSTTTGGGSTGGSTGSGSTGSTSGSCSASATGVTICAPTTGSSVTSPVTIDAAATAPNPISAMAIYVDNALVGKYAGSSVDIPIVMTTGNHYVVVQAWDSNGAVYKTAETISVTTATASTGGSTSGLSNLQHIFFMLQENRSFDNYFGMLGQYRAQKGYTDAFDGLPPNVTIPDMSGNPVAPYHYNTVCVENTTPSWNESHYDAHVVNTDYLSMNSSTAFLMDRFLQTTGSIPSTIDPQGTRAIGYYDWTDLPYYYELATQFATSDRMFSPVMANTVPNRMFEFTGTSWGNAFPVSPPSGGFTQKNIFQALDAAGISWRYYYVDNSIFLAQFSNWPQDQGKVYPISSYYTDVQDPSTLPQVIFIERGATSGLDEHPGSNVQTGAALVAKIMNSLMQSPTWASSAFILSFDEAGGLYDHVPPQPAVAPDSTAPILSSSDIPAQFNLTGFRVPFVIASPWTKPHFVSHKVRDLTSILKLIETRFNLPPLTQRDANADDLEEFFDFTNPAWLTPPPLPAQPTNGTCDFQQEKAPGY